jgi:predicted O-linked N-acetylglucosamine transferase (SPINDLY family)
MSQSSIDQAMQLALQHHQARRLDQAEAIYRRLLQAHPDQPDALHYLGVLLHQRGQSAEACRLLEQAIALRPQMPHFYCNAVPALLAVKRYDDAIRACERALSLKPQYGEALYMLGLAWRYKGDFEKALEFYRKAVEAKPDHAEAWNALGMRLRDKGELAEALSCYNRALSINPSFADAHNNVGLVLRDLGSLDDALAAHQRASELLPGSAAVHSNIANVLKDMGNLDQAVESYRKALAIEADSRIGSNMLYALLFDEKITARQLREEHRWWNDTFARPLARSIRLHSNDPDSGRRLRIAYSSPNLRAHPVGRFLFPLITNHDANQFEVFCYSDARRPDGVTELIKSRAGVWRETRGASDEQLAELIRQDGIDILIDTAMHMEDSRMLLFARKPAPVQVTYLAYAGTTGLETMDYRLTDAYLDPPGQDESIYSEKSVRLRSYWCYQPAKDTPPVGPLPILASGQITFGCLNNFCKMTPGTFAAWAEILRRVPKSRLILHTREGSHRQRTRERFWAQGIAPDRIEFIEGLPMPDYFAKYNQIDIALDAFPYPGGTTTCDALWMGVPVVTLPRQSAISRGGLSILTFLGLPELISASPEDYVRIAAELAGDLSRLSQLRSTMRERMKASALMDIQGFRRDVEAAYRQMWLNWCRAKFQGFP